MRLKIQERPVVEQPGFEERYDFVNIPLGGGFYLSCFKLKSYFLPLDTGDEDEYNGKLIQVAEPPANRPLVSLSLNQQLETLERELIVRAMEQARGVKTQAAEILGIKTSALYYKLGKYGLE
jgi:DNA-binding NtrC family response regulator